MSVWVGHSVATVKLPQAVLPAKKIMPTLFPGPPRPIFRLFCSDAIGVLWRYRAEREVDANGIFKGLNMKKCFTKNENFLEILISLLIFLVMAKKPSNVQS